MKNSKKKGFTLVELLVVIAILATLATVTVVGYLGFTEKAKISAVETELVQLKTNALAKLADGKEVEGETQEGKVLSNKTTYTFDPKEGSIVLILGKGEEGTFHKNADEAIADLLDAKKYDSITVTKTGSEKEYTVTEVTYTNGDYQAVWNIKEGTVKGIKKA